MAALPKSKKNIIIRIISVMRIDKVVLSQNWLQAVLKKVRISSEASSNLTRALFFLAYPRQVTINTVLPVEYQMKSTI